MPSTAKKPAAGQLPRFVVIMAGGESTRLWPLSRREVPKPFLPLLAGGQSLLQATVERLVPLVGAERILIVGHQRHRRRLREQLPQLPREHILTEPEARNTAACLRFAAAWIAARHSDATMLCLPADHLIRDHASLRRGLKAGIALAERHRALVVIGVPPRGPDTGYGYIEPAEEIDGSPAARWVRRFVEKPAMAKARQLIKAGARWNAGMFVWRVSDFVAGLEQVAPQFNRGFEGLFATQALSPHRQRAAYAAVPSQAIDVVLLQALSTHRSPVRPLAMVPGQFDWEDVGSWNRVAALWGHDSNGTSTVGEAHCVESTGCVIHSDGRRTVVFGVRDLVVVNRSDVVLVMSRDCSESIRQMQKEMRERGWEDLL